mmetsp:Transcript_15639/g.43325  ORF Transcript_15639/g.43325 Transcript_15639/m.43325 type:complete len:206 (+) Transcript_15639:2707-3324(+)
MAVDMMDRPPSTKPNTAFTGSSIVSFSDRKVSRVLLSTEDPLDMVDAREDLSSLTLSARCRFVDCDNGVILFANLISFEGPRFFFSPRAADSEAEDALSLSLFPFVSCKPWSSSLLRTRALFSLLADAVPSLFIFLRLSGLYRYFRLPGLFLSGFPMNKMSFIISSTSLSRVFVYSELRLLSSDMLSSLSSLRYRCRSPVSVSNR